MATTMDVESRKPGLPPNTTLPAKPDQATNPEISQRSDLPPKPLSGHFRTQGTSTAPERDPRLAGATKPAGQLQAAQRPSAVPNPLVSSTLSNSSPPTTTASLSTHVPGPRPSETTATPTTATPISSDPPSISDLINSLFKINKEEDDKARLDKEVVSLTKQLQRAKQFPQFPGTIASLQSQLDKVKDELAFHAKSIAQQRARSAQAELSFNAALLKPKLDPDFEAMSDKFRTMEAEVNELKKLRETPVPVISDEQPPMTKADIEKCIHDHNQFTAHVARQFNKIADSVKPMVEQHGKWRSEMSKLVPEVNAANKEMQAKMDSMAQMTANIEGQLKLSSDRGDGQMAMLLRNVQGFRSQSEAFKARSEGRLSDIEKNLQNFLSGGDDRFKDAFTVVSTLDNSMEAQRQHLTGKITAEEDRLSGLLKAKEMNKANSLVASQGSREVTSPHVISTGVDEKFRKQGEELTKHGIMLEKIQEIHAKAHDAYFNEMGELRNVQISHEAAHAAKHQELVKAVAQLTEITNKAAPADVSAKLNETKAQLMEEVNKSLDSLKYTPAAVAKCQSWIETYNTSLRSLEERYSNITTSQLVSLMSREMQAMYPSVGQLGQQLTDYRTGNDQKIVNIQQSVGEFATEVFKLRDALKITQADIKTIGAENEKAMADKNTEAQRLQPATDNPRHQLAPEQLEILKQFPDLMQKLHDLQQRIEPMDTTLMGKLHDFEQKIEPMNTTLMGKLHDLEQKIEPMNTTLMGHVEELRARLQETSDLKNSYESVSQCFVQLSEDVDQLAAVAEERQAEHKDVARSVEKIGILRENIDSHTVQLNKVVQDVEGHTAQLSEIIAKNQSMTHGSDSHRASEDEKIAALQSQLKHLEDQIIPTAVLQLDAEHNDAFEDIRSRLKDLEEPGPELVQERMVYRKELEEKLTGYLKRLRKVEDWGKESGWNPKKSVADKPMDQRVETPELPQSSSNSSKASRTPVSTATPKRPSLYHFMPSPKGKESSQPEERSSTSEIVTSFGPTSLPSSIQPQPRQVQALKTKRRRESAGPESGRATSESSTSSALDTSAEKKARKDKRKADKAQKVQKAQKAQKAEKAQKAAKESNGGSGTQTPKKRKL